MTYVTTFENKNILRESSFKRTNSEIMYDVWSGPLIKVSKKLPQIYLN